MRSVKGSSTLNCKVSWRCRSSGRWLRCIFPDPLVSSFFHSSAWTRPNPFFIGREKFRTKSDYKWEKFSLFSEWGSFLISTFCSPFLRGNIADKKYPLCADDVIPCMRMADYFSRRMTAKRVWEVRRCLERPRTGSVPDRGTCLLNFGRWKQFGKVAVPRNVCKGLLR